MLPMPIRLVLSNSLKEYQKAMEDAGFEKRVVDERRRGAEDFVGYLLGDNLREVGQQRFSRRPRGSRPIVG